MAVKTERSQIRQITRYLIILDMGAVLERILLQKRAISIIFPLCSYNEALVESGLTKLSDRRQDLVDKLFKNVLQNEQNKLHELLPARNTCTFNLRNMGKFKPAFKTNRFRSSFIKA